MNDDLAHELYSLLIPLAQERLIVPRACVAEVVTWQAPEKMEGTPAVVSRDDSVERRDGASDFFRSCVRPKLAAAGHAYPHRGVRRAWQPDYRRLFRRDHTRLSAAGARQRRRGESTTRAAISPITARSCVRCACSTNRR